MPEPLYDRHASALYVIVESAGVPPLEQIALRPGVRGVYRITVHYYDGRARDSVATLVNGVSEGLRLEIVYRVTFHQQPLKHRVTPRDFDAFVRVLHSIHFDHLPDQPDLPSYGSDLWLVERAAGSFSKSVILAPETAEGVYRVLVAAVKTYLPEALRIAKATE